MEYITLNAGDAGIVWSSPNLARYIGRLSMKDYCAMVKSENGKSSQIAVAQINARGDNPKDINPNYSERSCP